MSSAVIHRGRSAGSTGPPWATQYRLNDGAATFSPYMVMI